MRCIYCKAENPSNAAACGKCGKAVPSSEATFVGNEPTNPSRPPSKAESPKETNQASKREDPQVASVATKTPATPEGWSISTTRAPAAAVPHGEFAPGTIIGDRYEILEILGQGGMGAVYKARDNELDRLVALKIIRPELTTNPEILKRFKQELILARQVTHRNVIRIFDLGQADGFKFITMEYLEGQDLRAVLRDNGKLPPEKAAKVILQICRALEAAHTEGVIHRDLKPQNIMLDANGRAYVMDFGIARSAHLPGMTQTGALVGTPEYMSPEQAKGEKLDERSDLFSLGAILYELLVGLSPYHSDTPLATLWKRIQEKAKPLTELDPTAQRHRRESSGNRARESLFERKRICAASGILAGYFTFAGGLDHRSGAGASAGAKTNLEIHSDLCHDTAPAGDCWSRLAEKVFPGLCKENRSRTR
jgi:serine/threonine protein kinase